MAIARSCKIGDEIPPLTKTMTQEAINLFEKSGGKTGPSQFIDEATAQKTLGTRGTVASGRMSLTFASEMLRPTSAQTSTTARAAWICGSCGRYVPETPSLLPAR